GQQRLTTIYLIFCIIRNLIIELGQESKVLDNLVAGVTQDMQTGEDINQYHLSLQYDSDSANFLENLASRDGAKKAVNNSSESANNLIEAAKAINRFIDEQLIKEAKYLKQFSSVLSNRIKIIRIETPNLKKALRVFETITDRGVGLTPIDLLKNHLFINASQQGNVKSTWPKLKSKWDKLIKNLYSKKEKPTRFFRYYIMSHYDVDLQDSFPEEDVYDWFVEQLSYNNINRNPLQFVDELIKASQHYRRFREGKNIDGSENRNIGNIKKWQHPRSTQYFILLLAGRYLEKDLFVRLCEQVENLLFIESITRSRRKDFNLIRTFSQWSRKLRSIKTNEQLSIFIQETFEKTINSWSCEFEVAFRELTDSNIAKYRLRYILAKLAQFVDEKAFNNIKPLDIYLNKSIHIEHILPQSGSTELVQSFDKPAEYDFYVKKLGNLTVLERSINSSISDKCYELKKQDYRESQMLITRSLVEKSNVGNNTQINRSVRSLELEQYNEWTSKSIDKRQNKLINLAKKVWGLSS
ncbi:MAG: DUF262 domain-containing protein, partial [Spirulinaceae cyanobacterium]